MVNMHKKYPEYCFNEHKGYGTKKKHFEKNNQTRLQRNPPENFLQKYQLVS